MPQAPRLPQRLWKTVLRGALLVLICVAPGFAAACPPDFRPFGDAGRSTKTSFRNVNGVAGRHVEWAPFGAKITLHAGYSAETNEYGHGILGPLTDRKTLNITMTQEGDGNNKFSCPRGDHLPLGDVFEDVMPRFADVDQDGMPEIITVVSDSNLGAQLRIYDIHGNQLAATPHIGTRFRWLAPIGAADLDGDGHVEIAYIDRPHLARLLRIWRYRDGRLEHVADMPGLTNHRIGEDFITGGIRDCGDGPEVLVADARWREVMAVRFDGRIQATPIGLFCNTEQVANLLACP